MLILVKVADALQIHLDTAPEKETAHSWLQNPYQFQRDKENQALTGGNIVQECSSPILFKL